MCFDVPKVVRNPGYEHGYDEESRNGRDIKVDILDGYIRTLEVFQVISEKTGVPEGYRNPPPQGKDWAYMGHREEGRQPTRCSCAPSLQGSELD